MANCGNCAIELKFGNTPILGNGKLISGETICLECFRKLVKQEMIACLKKYTLEEVKAKLCGVQQAESRIRVQLEKIGMTGIFLLSIRKELSELPFIIGDCEELYGLVQGIYNGGKGILIQTNKRLLFIDKGLLYGLKVETFKLDNLIAVQYDSINKIIRIKTTLNGIANIASVERYSGQLFCEKVSAKLGEPQQAIGEIVVQHQTEPVLIRSVLKHKVS